MEYLMMECGASCEGEGSGKRPQRVVMLLANPFTHDTRVFKQARTLIEWGLEVHIVCIAKSHLPVEEVKDGIHIHRVGVKDVSIIRAMQGVMKLGSRDGIREWLARDFEQETLVGGESISKMDQEIAKLEEMIRCANRGEEIRTEDLGDVEEPDGSGDDVEVPVCEDEDEELGSFKMSVYGGGVSLIDGWVRVIQGIEGRLNSEEGSMLSRGGGAVYRKPFRVCGRLVLMGLRGGYRVVGQGLSRRLRVGLSRATSEAMVERAARVREERVARIHSERAAEREAKLARIRTSRENKDGVDVDPTDGYRLRIEELKLRREEIERERASKQRASDQRRKRWLKRLRKVVMRVPSAIRIIGFNDELARKGHALGPDLVLSHDCNTLLGGRMLKTALGVPLVYDSHELFLERNIGSRRRWVDKLCWWPVERGCIGATDARFTVAEGIARHLEKQYGLDEVHLLRNVQPYEAPPRVERTPSLLHEELGIDPGVRIVIYPGAITINRGIETMIDGAHLLENAVFVVMGYANSDEYMESLVERARANGALGKTFFFKDAVEIDRVGEWVSGASLGVVPTVGVCQSYRFEASNKMFHCIMAGVPLSMSDHPEKGILARRHRVGVLFDERDPASVARVINETLDDEGLMEEMRGNCLELAKTLNWEHEIHRYLTVMSGLLPEHGVPVPDVRIEALEGRDGCVEVVCPRSVSGVC